MEVYRLSADKVVVDGQLLSENKDHWSTITNSNVSQIRLQALYLFLRNENIAAFRRFKIYVDKVIAELI